MKGFDLKSFVQSAGGPMAVLMNPNAMKTVGEGAASMLRALPPAPILAGAAASLFRTALVTEWKRADPSESFMELCRQSGKFADDAGIVSFRNRLLEEI